MFLIVVFKFYFFNVYFLVAAAFIEIYCQYITILNLKPRLSDSLHSRSFTLIYFSITLLRLKVDVTMAAKVFLDRHEHLHCPTKEETYGLPFCY